jgi:hypothetical protein
MDDDRREEMEEKVAGEEESVDIGLEKILGSNAILVGVNSLPGKSHGGHLI